MRKIIPSVFVLMSAISLVQASNDADGPEEVILSLSGGGARGFLQVLALQKLEQDLFPDQRASIAGLMGHMYATSTGAILALVLSVTDQDGRYLYTASEMADLYEELSRIIFVSQSWGEYLCETRAGRLLTYIQDYSPARKVFFGLQELFPALKKLSDTFRALRQFFSYIYQLPMTQEKVFHNTSFARVWAHICRWEKILSQFCSGWFSPKYTDKGFRNLGKTYFPKKKFSDLKGDVTILCVDYPQQKLHYFNTIETQQSGKSDIWVEDLLCAATAAPGYFPAVTCKSTDEKEEFGLSDGGSIANSPLFIAYTKAKLASPTKKLILSLETGGASLPITDEQAKNWGIIQHLVPLIYSLLRGNHTYQDDCIRQLIHFEHGEDQYFRFHPILPSHLDQLDDISPPFFEGMRDIARAYFETNEYKRLLERLRPFAKLREMECLNVAPRKV